MENSTNKSETCTIRSVLRTFSFRVHTISGHSNDNNPYFSGKIISNCTYSRAESRGMHNFECLLSESIDLNTGFSYPIDYFNLEMETRAKTCCLIMVFV